jgi:hypothetical protein
MKVIINRSGTTFSLSNQAFEKLIEMGWEVMKEKYYLFDEERICIIKYEDDSDGTQKYGFSKKTQELKEIRISPKIIKVVEDMGQMANGLGTEFKIVVIPDDVEWKIEYYMGAEIIREKHRVWF